MVETQGRAQINAHICVRVRTLHAPPPHTGKEILLYTCQEKVPNICLIAGGEDHSKFKSHIRNPKGNDDRPDHMKTLSLRRI